MMIRPALALALAALALTGCGDLHRDGVTLEGRISLPAQAGGLHILAPAYARADIDTLSVGLFASTDTNTTTQLNPAFQVTPANLGLGTFGATVTVRFNQVRNGSYIMGVTALKSGAAIGFGKSATPVTVDALAGTPVSGSLSATVQLNHGTGETVRSSLVVVDGGGGGQPEGAPL
jgi:hypothetical protein